jgi:excisionase family DNA binding protein
MESRLTALEERLARLEQKLGQVPVDPDLLYTMAEVAERLRCGKTNVYGLVDEKALAVIRVGAGKGGLRVKGSDLQAFLDSRKTGGPKPEFKFKNLRIPS